MKKNISNQQKEIIKRQIRDILSNEQEVQKILIFGSFIKSDTPNDIDIAVFQNSKGGYLSLSMKYRKLLRTLGILHLPVYTFWSKYPIFSELFPKKCKVLLG